jgi:hypothetical protein
MRFFSHTNKWEYKLAYVDGEDTKELEERMNRRGNQRWELVATIPEKGRSFRMIYKRKRTSRN